MIPPIGFKGRCRLVNREHPKLRNWDTNPNRTYPVYIVQMPSDELDLAYAREHGESGIEKWVLIGTSDEIYSCNTCHFAAHFEVVK